MARLDSKVLMHSANTPRDHWLTEEEKRAIVDYAAGAGKAWLRFSPVLW